MINSKEYIYGPYPSDVREKILYYSTVQAFLEFCKTAYGNKPAICDGTTTITYQEFYENIARRRAFMQETNIPVGSNIAVLNCNDRNAFELFLGIITAGYCLIMLPNALDASALRSICDNFDIKGLFVSDELKKATEGFEIPVFSSLSTSQCNAPMEKAEKDTPAAIFFTGGTTSAPKGAILTHGALMRGAFNGTKLGVPFWDRRSVVILPMSHIFGAVVGFMSMLYTGALLFSSSDAFRSLTSLPQTRPTNLLLVPGLLEVLLSMADARGKEIFGGVTTITCGGAPLSVKDIERARAYGVNIVCGYGLTENSAVATVNYCCDEKPESVGRRFPEEEVKIIDKEICFRGDNLMVGYYNDVENTSKVLRDGWLRTGDIGRIDDDGFLYITGRIKNLIILPNGENVSPEELENFVYHNPLVKECIAKETMLRSKEVIGIEIFPDMSKAGDKTVDEVKDVLRLFIEEVNAMLPPFKRISSVLFRAEEFPKSRAMKIIRGA